MEWETSDLWSMRSNAIKDYLGRYFYQLTSKGANRNAMADAMSTLRTAILRKHYPHSIVPGGLLVM